MTDALAQPATMETKCQGCHAPLSLSRIEAPQNKPTSTRWRGTCAKCGTEMTVTTSEETSTQTKDVDWHREKPEGGDP